METPKKEEEEEEEENLRGGGSNAGCFRCGCVGGITNEEDGNEIFHLQKEARVWPMVRNALLGLMPALTVGMSMGSTAPTLEFYKSEETAPLKEGPLSDEQSSWFVSILSASMMVGNLLSCPLSDLQGRRQTLTLASAAITTGWLAIGATEGLPMLLVGRVIVGVGVGLLDPTSHVMLSEITLIRFRGVLGVMNILMLNLSWLSCLVVFAWAPFSFRTCLLVCATPPTVFLILSRFMEESPLWLVKRGMVSKAERTLLRLRGRDYPALEEVKEIVRCFSKEEKEEQRDPTDSYCRRFATKLRQLATDGEVRRPTIILSTMFVFQIMSGAEAMSYYSLEILHRAGLPEVDRYLLACLQHVSLVLGILCSAPIMARADRRRQFVASAVAMGVAVGALGACLTAKDSGAAAADGAAVGSPLMTTVMSTLPPLSLVLATFFYGLGVGPVCFTLIGELFPAKAKAFCSGTVIAIRYLVSSLVLKLFPAQVNLLGLGGAFICNSMCCFLASGFVLRFLPETQGLTLTQLERLFRDDKSTGGGEEGEKGQTREELLLMNTKFGRGEADHRV